MKDYILVVRSNPVPGREEEYNRWYNEQHLADVVAVPGFVSAQRFKLADPTAEGAPAQRYMALYNMKTDNPASLIDQLGVLTQSGKMHISDALSQEDLAVIVYETLGPAVTA